MPLIQLKPLKESFYIMVFDKLAKLDSIVLCEGKTEVETVKHVVEKTGLKVNLDVGLADCEGITVVPRIVQAIAALAKIARKIRSIEVLVDSEKQTYHERVSSIIDSLRAKNINVEEPVLLENSKQVFKTNLRINEKTVALIVAVSGIENYPFKKHTIENHALKLMILENKAEPENLNVLKEAKDLVNREKILEIISGSSIENIEKAFNHIVRMLKEL